MASVKFNYPKDKYQIYEPEPNPNDHSILSNFTLSDMSGNLVIDGEFYNATTRDKIKFVEDFTTKNALKSTEIGYRGVNNNSNVTAYTETENGKTIYYFPISGSENLYILMLRIPTEIASSQEIKNILLSVYTY